MTDRTAMTHEEAAELLGAFALDAVEPEEAVLVAAHVAECPRCTAELAEHREVAGMLGDLGGDAPPELWETIASQATAPEDVAAHVATGDVGRPHRAPRRRRPYVRVAVGCVAVAAAVAIALLGVQVSRLDDRVSQLSALASSHGLSEAAQAALLDPNAVRIALEPASGHGQMVAELVIVPLGHSFLVDSSLHALPTTQTYQLWAVTSGVPISLGLLGADPDVVPFVVNEHSSATTFAVTVEPASGSKGPTTTPIAAGA